MNDVKVISIWHIQDEPVHFGTNSLDSEDIRDLAKALDVDVFPIYGLETQDSAYSVALF